MFFYRKLVAYLVFFLLSVNVHSGQIAEFKELNYGFPRFMGMAIGKKNYDDPVYRYQLSRVDVLILGFYPGWGRYKGYNAEQEAVRAIKKLNPDILIGQYTILNEASASDDVKSASRDKGKKIDAENWWLRDENGERVQWTKKYNKWDVNISSKVKKDRDGLRYPEWIARRDYRHYFKNIPEFDIWYLDNALSRPAVKEADWDLDGKNENRSNLAVSREYRTANIAEWNEIKKLQPNILLLGNSNDISSQEYKNNLNGVFMEALIGKSWSMERSKGWSNVMKRYRQSMKYTAFPHLVGFNVWGQRNDFQRMRYGLASCLLDNGYFTYTDEDKGYSSVPWFDEFDVDLGEPVDVPPKKEWKNGVYRRNFENGLVLVNPNYFQRTVEIEKGYKKFKGLQAPLVNSGMPVKSVTIPGKDGILLVRTKF